jgi:hypothetical protein
VRLSKSREQAVKGVGKENNKDGKSGKGEDRCTFAFHLASAVGEAVVGFGVDASQSR